MEVSNEFYSGFLVLYFMNAFIIWLGLFWWIFDFHIFNVISNCIAWLFSIIFFIIIFVFVIYLFFILFFLSGFSFTDTDGSQDSRVREGTIFYSTLPLPPAHEHWDINLQLCMWDDYHVFLIATLVFIRLLFDEIYQLMELPFDWLNDDAMFACLLDKLILGFCYRDLTWETGGLELASTITLV